MQMLPTLYLARCCYCRPCEWPSSHVERGKCARWQGASSTALQRRRAFASATRRAARSGPLVAPAAAAAAVAAAASVSSARRSSSLPVGGWRRLASALGPWPRALAAREDRSLHQLLPGASELRPGRAAGVAGGAGGRPRARAGAPRETSAHRTCCSRGHLRQRAHFEATRRTTAPASGPLSGCHRATLAPRAAQVRLGPGTCARLG